MREFYARNKRQLDKFFFVAGLFLGAYIFVVYLFPYVAPFCLAYVVAMIAQPVVRYLHTKLKIHRGLSALACLILFVTVISVLGVNLINKLWHEVVGFSTALPVYLAEFLAVVDQLKLNFFDYFRMLPESWFNTLSGDIMAAVTAVLGENVKSTSVNVVALVPHLIINMLVFFISAFFFIKDWDYIHDVVAQNSPPAIIRSYRMLKKGLLGALGGYVKAQGIIMTIIAIINISALMLIRYPYALMMGLLIAFVDALPVMGSGFVLWPWAILQLIMGNYTKALSLFSLYGVNLFTRQLLEPKVLSTQIGLYPLLTLMSIYVGLKLFGGLGFFIGPVLVLSIKALIQPDESHAVNR